MELKPGYKHSEVGVIPEEWESTSVSAVASSARNAIVGGPFGSDLVSRDYVDDGVPVIRGQNMGGRWIEGTFAFVSPKKADSLEANLARPGDIVFTQRGTLGQVSLVPDAPYTRYLVSQSQMKVTLSHDVAEPAFFYYLFSGEEQQERIRQNTIQTGVPHINLGILRDIPVPRPPLLEQRAIAGALGDADALLNALEKLIAKKRDIRQAAMQQLLTGQTRLPGFSGEWEAKSILEMADKKKELFDDGDWIEAEFLEESGIRLIQTGNIGQGRFEDKESRKYISPESFKELRCKDISVGDILICRLAEPAGRACILPDIGETRLVTAVDVTIFRPPPALADRRFLVHVFSTRDWFSAVNERCGGSTRTGIARGELGRIEVNLPPIDEQAAIADVLFDMDAEIAALEARLAKTRAVKQGMMQELLTGRTRLV